VMILSSAALGMRTMGRLETFDIVLYLTTICAAQADYPSHFATVYKRNVVQNRGLRSECNHPNLVILKAIINPHQRGFPIELASDRQGHAMLSFVGRVLDGVEIDFHALL